MDGQMRVCEPELHMFEECVHDPRAYSKFKALATPVQNEGKNFYAHIIRKNYFF